MYYVLVGIYVLVCLVLSLVILLQQGRGGDIASAFGGSSSQAAFGARSGATLLTKATSVAAVLFMLFALALSIVGQRSGGGSLLSGTPAPVPAALPKPAPSSPPPPTPLTAPTGGSPSTPAPAPAK
jgi:preprotein translocase subunit SecG